MSRSTGSGQIENTFIRFYVFTIIRFSAIAFIRFCCIVMFMDAEHDVTAAENIEMENQLVIEMVANRVAEYVRIGGVSLDAAVSAAHIAAEYVQGHSVGNVVRHAKKLTADAVATCTKLSEMLHAETISESDLTGSVSKLAYNVFVGFVQQIASNGEKA